MSAQPTSVELAIAELADQSGLDPAAIEVVSQEDVTWLDGSLGCPEPGRYYTQSLVEGYRIVLRASGTEVSFHGANGQPPFRCGNPDPRRGGQH